MKDEVLETYGDRFFNEPDFFVYALDCRVPRDESKIESRANSLFDDGLFGVGALKEAKRAIYVGSTNDLHRRLGEHERGRGSKFTKLCEPHEWRLIKPAYTRKQAKRRERRLAESYYDPSDSTVFVYSDQLEVTA